MWIKNDEIRLERYTTEWKKKFNKVKKVLMEKIKLEVYRIEHIGSTAIKDMAAKPIIDIAVGIDALKQADKPLMQSFNETGF